METDQSLSLGCWQRFLFETVVSSGSFYVCDVAEFYDRWSEKSSLYRAALTLSKIKPRLIEYRGGVVYPIDDDDSATLPIVAESS